MIGAHPRGFIDSREAAFRRFDDIAGIQIVLSLRVNLRHAQKIMLAQLTGDGSIRWNLS
jgi:hypothetical protein